MSENNDNARDRFLANVANHRMKVKHDQGFYRHLHFAKPGDTNQWFEIVTFPNVLVINGDMGTWTFSRVQDMFTFFRDHNLRINRDYWSEKLMSVSRFGGPEKLFDRDTWIAEVIENLNDCFDEDEDAEEIAEIKAELHLAVFYGEYDEQHLRRNLEGFGRGDFKFTDSLEIEGKQWSPHFIWCLYAIVWGIQKYDAAKVEAVAA